MRASVMGVVALCVGAAMPAFTQQASPAIREIGPVSFPAYNAYRGIAGYATAAEYAEAIADRSFVMERVTYRSDDLDVYAYLYRPAALQKGTRLPVVVFNRGSYVRDDFCLRC